MNFKELLIKERNKRGITIGYLSVLSGIPKTTIQNYENGTMPSLEKADKLLRALGVEITIGKSRK